MRGFDVHVDIEANAGRGSANLRTLHPKISPDLTTDNLLSNGCTPRPDDVALRAWIVCLRDVVTLKTMQSLSASATGLICLLLFSDTAPAQQVFRCTDARGNPVFSQSPCSADPGKMEVVDTSRALKTGSSGPATAPDEDACAKREREITENYAADNAKLDRQIAELRSSDQVMRQELSSRKEELRKSEIEDRVQARMECSKPAAPSTIADQPPKATDVTDSVQTPPRFSWRCTTANGLEFYRHDGCPTSIRDRPVNPLLRPDERPQPIEEMPVRAEQLPRNDACQRISAPAALKRWGSNRDQRPQGDKSDC